MPKLRVVESGICDTWRGFGRGVERFCEVGSNGFGLGDAGVLGFRGKGIT